MNTDAKNQIESHFFSVVFGLTNNKNKTPITMINGSKGRIELILFIKKSRIEKGDVKLNPA